MKLVFLTALLISLTVSKKGGLRKGTEDPNIVNPDTDDTDIEEKFEAGLFEGDIIKSGENQEDRNAMAKREGLWPAGKVPYVIDSSIHPEIREKILEAIEDFTKNTCIKWVKRQQEKAYVKFNGNSGSCSAYMGRFGSKQDLYLGHPVCKPKGSVIHEMMHTVGFGHEQARNDRDKYITVHWNNMLPSMRDQFRKLGEGNEKTQGFGYDYSSVMHYKANSFARTRGLKTITTADKSKQNIIGQRKGFSKQDIMEINKLYKCESGGLTDDDLKAKKGECYDKFSPNSCKHFIRQFGKSICTPGASDLGAKCKRTCGQC